MHTHKSKYFRVVHCMLKWFEAILLSLPVRTIPIIGTDLNDKVGLSSIDGALTPHSSLSLGKFALGIENECGKLFRECCERNQIALMNSFFDCGPTFYSAQRTTSNIDWIGVPVGAKNLVRRVFIPAGAAKRLQLPNTKCLIDHVPIFFEFKMVSPGPGSTRNGLDMDKMMQGWLGDAKVRDAFTRDVESEFSERWQEFDEVAHSSQYPDNTWDFIVDVVSKNTEKHFLMQRECKRKALDDEKWTLLKDRRKLREQRAHTDELADVQKRIILLSRKLKHDSKDKARVRRKKLCAELLDHWRRRNFSLAWKVAYRLGGEGCAPRKRTYKYVTRCRPLVPEFESALGKKGSEGGLSYVPTTLDKLREEREKKWSYLLQPLHTLIWRRKILLLRVVQRYEPKNDVHTSRGEFH